MEQAIKIRNLVKTAGVFSGGGGGGAGAAAATSAVPRRNGDPTTVDTLACERLRAAREQARLVEQHAEILVLSLRLAKNYK